MTDPDGTRRALSELKRRLSTGEIGAEDHSRRVEMLLDGFSAEERAAVGGPPQPRGPAHRGPLGPRGADATQTFERSTLEIAPGTVLFGQWRVVREIGRGRFAAVLEAEDLALESRVALKVLDPELVRSRRELEAFRDEVGCMRTLTHPGIVRVFDYRQDLDRGTAVLSMELIEGCTLLEVLARARADRRPLPQNLVRQIMSQILEALAPAHREGVVHRDVAPQNVLVVDSDAENFVSLPPCRVKVKLTDFGIASLVTSEDRERTSRAAGTIAYLAPETLDPDRQVTPAADVYGVAAVGYALLTLRPAIGKWEPPQALNADVPAELGQVIERMLDAEPSGRPPDAAAALALLARGPNRGTAPAPSGNSTAPEVLTPAARLTPVTGSLRRAFGIAVLLAALLATGAGLLWHNSLDDDPEEQIAMAADAVETRRDAVKASRQADQPAASRGALEPETVPTAPTTTGVLALAGEPAPGHTPARQAPVGVAVGVWIEGSGWDQSLSAKARRSLADSRAVITGTGALQGPDPGRGGRGPAAVVRITLEGSDDPLAGAVAVRAIAVVSGWVDGGRLVCNDATEHRAAAFSEAAARQNALDELSDWTTDALRTCALKIWKEGGGE